ncbi:MAG: LysR family transcriptional regulator [Alicyclobacillus sp.]|nr:LysR family transcriptional regulator [Alicyclobacillus sp.]
MNIENMEAFVYVCHLGSFSKAAEALFLTQPAVTARIQSLERDLGTRLFHRNRAKVTLTPEGESFFPYAQHILQAYQAAKLKLQDELKAPKELRIGCATSIANYLIPELLPAFHRRFPAVRTRVLTGHSNDILVKVLNGEVDFGIVRTVTHPKVESLLFRTDPIGLFVPPGHPFLSGGSVTIEQVAVEPLIFFDYGSMDWLMIQRMFTSKGLQPNIVFEVDSMETAKRSVMHGAGISFLPFHCAQQELEQQHLFHVPLSPPVEISIRMDFIYLRDTVHSPFLKFFAGA